MYKNKKLKYILFIYLGILLVMIACEDKPGHPRILSRPTLPNNKGLNIGDTTLDYYDNSSKRYPFNQNEHNTDH